MNRAASGSSVFGLALGAILVLSLPALADRSLELGLTSGPHAPNGAPDAVVHVPTRLDPRKPVHWLIFLHGFSSCARALLAPNPAQCQPGVPAPHGYGLATLHEQARSNTILIVPQLAYLARESRAPRFERPGGFAELLQDVRDRLRHELGSQMAPASISLLAHSAGYRAAAAILQDERTPKELRNVVLFDALYAEWAVFARWLQAGEERRILSFHTSDRSTTRGNRHLRALVGKTKRLHTERVDTPHRAVPERHLAGVLDALFGHDGPAKRQW